MQISFIIPSRNNYRFLKWSYDSIRKNQGNHDVQICVADDASTDGTWEWCQETMQRDKHFQAIRNDGPERQGLVILNDRLVNEVAKHDLCIIYHADMYLCPGALDAIEKHLKETASGEFFIRFYIYKCFWNNKSCQEEGSFDKDNRIQFDVHYDFDC